MPINLPSQDKFHHISNPTFSVQSILGIAPVLGLDVSKLALCVVVGVYVYCGFKRGPQFACIAVVMVHILGNSWSINCWVFA